MRIRELLEAKTITKTLSAKPRNFVAKNAPTSGAGRHKDSSKKKDIEQGKVKHKKDLVSMENQGVAESQDPNLAKAYRLGFNAFKAGNKDALNTIPKQYREMWIKGWNDGENLPKEGVTETATAGSTSAGNVSVGAVYKNKSGKTYKNKDGTVKNALDVKGANLMTGGSIKR